MLSWLQVCFASGTGATALFAARHVARHNLTLLDIVALPCVGTEADLLAMMIDLDRQTGSHGHLPIILSDGRKRVFAKPTEHHLRVWREVQAATGVLFDLVYAPRAWEQLKHSVETSDPRLWGDPGGDGAGACGVLYYHCGGVEGNASQLRRYERLGLLRP